MKDFKPIDSRRYTYLQKHIAPLYIGMYHRMENEANIEQFEQMQKLAYNDTLFCECIDEIRLTITNHITDIQFKNATLNGVDLIGGNYVTYAIADKTKLAYIPTARLPLFTCDFLDEELRKKYAVMVKPHKLLKRLIPDISETALNKLVIDLFPAEKVISILEGDDINKIYDSELLPSNTGNLHSCMINHHDNDKFEIYRDNARAIVFATKDLSKIYARAILWIAERIDTGENVEYCDRIYYNTESDEQAIKDYCRENNIDFSGLKPFARMKINCKTDISNYSMLPYMDTFYYAESGRSTLYNYNHGQSIEVRDYENGTPFADIEFCSCGCGLSCHSDDMVAINYEYYHPECENIIRIDGEYYLQNECSYSNYEGEYHHREDDSYVYCEYIDDTVCLHNTRYCEVTNEYYLTEDTIELENGDIVFNELAEKCEKCGTWQLKKDFNDGICEECQKELTEQAEQEKECA